MAELPTAQTIAELCRGMPDNDAAALIEKYADMIASIRVHDAVRGENTRIISLLEGTFHPTREEA